MRKGLIKIMIAVFDSIQFAVRDVVENFPQISGHFFSSLILIVTVMVLRRLVINGLRSTDFSMETKRRWSVYIKNFSLVLMLLGLAIIWGSELRSFALSLVAIAAALAIATKEVILCFMGGLYKASAGPFDIGDRIELGGYRGDVLDHDLLSTTLIEIGPGQDLHQFTGKTIKLPNSLMLSHAVVNESRSVYDIHTFRVPITPDKRWVEYEQKLLAACEMETSDYLESAERHLARQERKEGLEAPNTRPRVSIVFVKPDEMHLVARVVVPELRKGKVEQRILRRYLKSIYEQSSN